MNYLVQFWNSPIGPKTTHFWGPVSNWGWVAQGWADRNRPAEKISLQMQASLTIYSMMFSRFAWRVQPRNYLLLVMHLINVGLQSRLLFKRLDYENELKKNPGLLSTPETPVNPVPVEEKKA